jgi:nicotinamidase-related amidase
MSATALLTMDVQAGLADTIGSPELLERIGAALVGAREKGLLVVAVRVGLRPGYPEVSERNVPFSQIAANGIFVEGESSTFDPVVAPREGEVEVVKHRIGAFSGTDLEMVLRANGVTDLVLSGISTSGVVLSTFRAALDLDYRLTVLRDCCADPDPEVHSVLLDKVYPRHASVVTVDEWLASAS